jgi:hypothetical protein
MKRKVTIPINTNLKIIVESSDTISAFVSLWNKDTQIDIKLCRNKKSTELFVEHLKEQGEFNLPKQQL